MRHAVPLFPDGGILQPEIGGQVDDLGIRLEQLRRHLHGGAVRRGEKNQVTRLECLRVRFTEGDVEMPTQVAVQVRDLPARLGARRDLADRHMRMGGQQAQQFNTGITGATNDANLDHRDLRCLGVRNRDAYSKRTEGTFGASVSQLRSRTPCRPALARRG